jgi:uncharacterized protein (DUF4415 family)
MTKKKWPSFVTKDLDSDSDADAVEMERRWKVYRHEMDALIAAGGVHQDDDGWWVDDATGELIGPDPEIERPLTLVDERQLKPFDQVFPEMAKTIRRRGPQKAPTKIVTTLRLDPDVLEGWRKTGRGWQTRVNEALRAALNAR